MSFRDRAVQKTDGDAANSKLSAVSKGYFADPYLQLFTRKAPPRFPLINIGTYCRVLALDRLVYKFLEQTKDDKVRQIVSLGAGSDTRVFKLLPHVPRLVYHELDFPIQTMQKKRIIKRSQLSTLIGEDAAPAEGPEIHTPSYHLHASDLRALPELPLDPTAPTLVLSECCLCYLEPAEAAAVLKFFADRVSELAVVLYEPIGLDDEFGRVMAENLLQRGLCLPTFRKFNTLEAQKDRLHELGLARVGAKDILQVYQDWTDDKEKKRIAALELLDEVEELHLLLRHYCIAWGSVARLEL